MAPTIIWNFLVAFILLCLTVKEIQTCDYAFVNLDYSMDIDWSSIVGSVAYSVQVQKIPENVPATDLVLEIDPPLTAFTLNEANSYEILVNECLTYINYYDIVVKITNDTRCMSGTLSLTTVLATPVYNMPTTELTATPNEDMFQIFTDAFTINILNDAVFGGCAAFSCTTLCLNDEGQDFLVDTHTNLVETRKSTLTLDFTYDLKVTCLDDIKHTFVTPGHSIYINITFNPETTSPEQTTSTTVTSTSVQTSTPEPTTTSMLTSTPGPTTPTTTPMLTSTPGPTTPTTTPILTSTPGPTTPTTTPMPTSTPGSTTLTTTPVLTSTPGPTTPTTTPILKSTPDPTTPTTTPMLTSTPDPTTSTSSMLTSTSSPTSFTTTPMLTSTPGPTTPTSTPIQTTTPNPTTPSTAPIQTSTPDPTTSTTYTTPTTSSTMPVQTTSVQATSTPHTSTSTRSQTTSSAASGTTVTPAHTTLGGSASAAASTGFFSKPENIVTVVLPAVAFGSAGLFGLGYLMRKKFKKSSVDPVLVA